MSARTLPIFFLSAILFLVTTAARGQLTYERVEIVDASFFVLTVQYAYEGENIKFAVFQRHYGEPGRKCSVIYSVRNEQATPISATLTLNDTTPRDLLKEGGLYQAENGVVRKVDLKFKTSELKEFLRECQRKHPGPAKEKENDRPAYVPPPSTANLTLDDFVAHLNRKNV